MYAIEAIFNRTEFVNGRAKFLRLETVAVGPLIQRRLHRNKHCALFSTQELADKLREICNPYDHTLAYRVRNRLFIAFDKTNVAKANERSDKQCMPI